MLQSYSMSSRGQSIRYGLDDPHLPACRLPSLTLVLTLAHPHPHLLLTHRVTVPSRIILTPLPPLRISSPPIHHPIAPLRHTSARAGPTSMRMPLPLSSPLPAPALAALRWAGPQSPPLLSLIGSAAVPRSRCTPSLAVLAAPIVRGFRALMKPCSLWRGRGSYATALPTHDCVTPREFIRSLKSMLESSVRDRAVAVLTVDGARFAEATAMPTQAGALRLTAHPPLGSPLAAILYWELQGLVLS